MWPTAIACFLLLCGLLDGAADRHVYEIHMTIDSSQGLSANMTGLGQWLNVDPDLDLNVVRRRIFKPSLVFELILGAVDCAASPDAQRANLLGRRPMRS